MLRASALPASVRLMARVVRINSAVPRCSSSFFSWWLTVEGLTPSAWAAPRRLLSRAMALNTSRVERGSFISRTS